MCEETVEMSKEQFAKQHAYFEMQQNAIQSLTLALEATIHTFEGLAVTATQRLCIQAGKATLRETKES